MIVDSQWSALDPSIMGLGPVLCSTAILRRHELALGDIELWEINEAFAAQVLACLAAWEDDDILPRSARPRRRGRRDRRATSSTSTAARIGLGHPVGASGNRIVLHLVNAMRRLGIKRGIASRMHRRRAGRRHADRDGVEAADDESLGRSSSRAIWSSARLAATAPPAPWRHWQLARDDDGIAWLVLDKQGASANTLSEEVLTELNDVLGDARARPAEGAGDPLRQAGGFIAGADIGEFRGMTDAAEVEAQPDARRTRSSTGSTV